LFKIFLKNVYLPKYSAVPKHFKHSARARARPHTHTHTHTQFYIHI